MLRVPIAALAGLALTLAAACATATGPAPAAPSWKQTMRAVDAQFTIVSDELGKRSAADLEAVANAARNAAGLVRLGYGVHEQKDVPGFAAMARACESWLLGIALEADSGHGEIAFAQLGKAERCAECHDRSGKRQW